MIRGFFLLLLFQLIGEVLARGLSLPAPGPVVGLALLVAAMAAWRAWRPYDDEALASSDVGRAADGVARKPVAVLRPRRRRGRAISRAASGAGRGAGRGPDLHRLSAMLATVGVFLLVKRLIGLGSEA